MGYKISVLVPVYGVENYIERCARSLFEQTYPDLEYVFVNDCTRDKSIAVLMAVAKDYPTRESMVRIVNHDKNRGIAGARNTGLSHATGEFVCIVDSDDWLETNALELLARQQQVRDADIVSGNRLIHNRWENMLVKELRYNNKEEMTLQMMRRSRDHYITGRLFRRSLFVDNNLQWNEGLDMAEDRFMMTLLAYHAKTFDVVDAVVYHYDQRNTGSITGNRNAQRHFKNSDQHIGNYLALKRFFEDKEEVYQKGCALCLLVQLKYNVRKALEFASRKEFNKYIGIIDAHQNEVLKSIDWQKNGIKGWGLHSYAWMRLVFLEETGIRFVSKRLRWLFSLATHGKKAEVIG